MRLGDIEAFTDVLRAGSITGAARTIGVGASQVSKAIARLERHLGVKLIVRSQQGVELSDDGRHLAPNLIELLSRAKNLEASAERPELVVAAPSFLWAALVARLSSLLRRVRVHAVETRSATMTAFANRPFFDAAAMVGDDRWPGSWVRVRVGFVRRALFATPAKAKELGAHAKKDALRREVFVGRLDSEQGRLVPVPDGCPLVDRERRFGHRAQTVGMALELARQSGELVFAPVMAARPYVRRGSLVEVAVEGWDVREPMYVVCHQDRVDARAQRALIQAARAELEADEPRIARRAAKLASD